MQSALGEALRAEIEVTSLTRRRSLPTCSIRIAPPEAYRAAGVDYNPVLPGDHASRCSAAPTAALFLRLTSDRAVQEPFVDVILEITWATGRLVREYTLLFDPPQHALRAARRRRRPPARAADLGRAAARRAAPPRRAPRRARAAPRVRAAHAAPAAGRRAPLQPRPPPARAGRAAPRRRRPTSTRCARGDTLSRIAGRTQRAERVARPDAGRAVPQPTPTPSSATT